MTDLRARLRGNQLVGRSRFHHVNSQPSEGLPEGDPCWGVKLHDLTTKGAHKTPVVVGSPFAHGTLRSLGAPEEDSELWHLSRVVREVCKSTKDILDRPCDDRVHFDSYHRVLRLSNPEFIPNGCSPKRRVSVPILLPRLRERERMIRVYRGSPSPAVLAGRTGATRTSSRRSSPKLG